METFKISMRDDLVSTLGRLVDHTEEIFLRLAEQCPALLSEMNTSLDRSNQLAVGVTRRSSSEVRTGIAAEIGRTHDLIAEGSTTFAQMHDTDDRQLGELDAAIQRLTDLEGLIFEIKEDSIEMELVSLNAMTVALKAGNAGLAFSYITEELKRLSSQTISLTDEITRRGERLRSTFSEFRESLAETRRSQNELFMDFREKLASGFATLRTGIDEVARTMLTIRERSMEVREPINAIMQEIQIQDIIKQSVGHVTISLRELNEVAETHSNEELLDELAFFKQLPDLCTAVLDDVAENIKRSLTLFRQQSDEAKAIVEDVETRRANFLDSLFSERDEHSIRSAFQRSSTLLQSLLADLDTSLRQKKRVAEQSTSLMKEVRLVEEDFHRFGEIISRFHNIDIASRIEVAKQVVLQRMSGTVEQMTSLTHKIDHDVDQALAVTKQFIDSVGRAVSGFQMASKQEERFIGEFSTSMSAQYEKLFAANTEFSEALSGFSLFTGRFLTLFTKTNEDLERLHRLVDEIERIKEQLQEIKREADRRMQPILRAMGETDWDIGNSRLQQMIERFTIFTHKKHAGQLGGFVVEDGVDSGEITFF